MITNDAPGSRARAAGRPGPRRWPHLALGAVWLLDAALQFQPYMFTRGFATQILAPAGPGSPALVAGTVSAAARLVAASPVAFNAVFAVVQLAIGAGLLWRRTARLALAASIAWALGVWALGEGLGGLLTGSASPVTGAPGAALLYALIAVLAWPSVSRTGSGQRRAERAGRISWAVLWVGSAALLLQPASLAAGALRGAVAGQAGGEPGWVAGLDRVTAAAIGSHGTAVSVALAVAFALIGAGVLVPRTARLALAAGAVAALAMWAAGQDFGGILTGQGTDPSTGPLLVLLAAVLWLAGPGRGGAGAPALSAKGAVAARPAATIGAEMSAAATAAPPPAAAPAGPPAAVPDGPARIGRAGTGSRARFSLDGTG